MNVSPDGCVVGPDGGLDRAAPDEEVFRFRIDGTREAGVHLMGRRPYETMLYGETADRDPSLDDSSLEWAALWKPLPEVVFSTTLSAVRGNARLASGDLAEESGRLRTGPGEDGIAIGGATPAAEAAASGLIDECRVVLHPVLVGGGVPFLPRRGRRVDLELVGTRVFGSGVVHLRHRVTGRSRASERGAEQHRSRGVFRRRTYSSLRVGPPPRRRPVVARSPSVREARIHAHSRVRPS